MAALALLCRTAGEIPLTQCAPALTPQYATDHDGGIAACLAALLDQADQPLLEETLSASQLALRHGGLGLRSAVVDRHAAYWASWVDSLPAVRARSPLVADNLVQALAHPGAAGSSSVVAATHAADFLRAQGCDVPA